MDQNYLGIIIPNKVYEELPDLKSGYDMMFKIFNETANQNGLILCFFTFYQIKPDQSRMKAYIIENNQYGLRTVPTPRVVYTRVLDITKAHRNHIKSLQKSGITVFNVPNYDVEKYVVHQLLMKDVSIKPHLPHTEVLSEANLKKMMGLYDSLILKLNYGEFGRGAMKLEKIENNWHFSYKPKGGKTVKTVIFKQNIPKVLLTRMKKTPYLIQEMIPLATYKGNPFDMRVAVQKNKYGKFQVSAIMCKVARKDTFLTNGAQGGTTYKLADISSRTHPGLTYYELYDGIASFSLKVAHYMDSIFPHLGDLGFDIGVTKEGKPYFIECNFISDYISGLFKGWELIYDEFKPVFTTPIEYGAYLLDQ